MYTKQLSGPNEGRITHVEDDRDAQNHITLGYAEESSEAAFKKQEKADAAKAAAPHDEVPAAKKPAAEKLAKEKAAEEAAAQKLADEKLPDLTLGNAP